MQLPLAIAVDAENVYWSDDHISTPTTRDDPGCVYWTDLADGSAWRAFSRASRRTTRTGGGQARSAVTRQSAAPL
jgi:hypothetical protein